MKFRSKSRPPLPALPLLPPIYQNPHPPIWVACLMSPESFEWTAAQGYNLLYVAYHVDHPVAAERLSWYRGALQKYGRKLADREVCCVYPAPFLDSDDDTRFEHIVQKPMSEYAAAGLEAARKPPDP